MLTRKHKAAERIETLLEDYRVLDSTIYIDAHIYGIHERSVRDALLALEKSDPSLETSRVVYRLLEAVLSQALNRDPGVSWIAGVKAVNGSVGKIA